MERKKLLYWGVQFAGWTAYFLFSVLILYSSESLKLTFNIFLFAGLSILTSVFVSHGIRYIIVKKDVISFKLTNLIFVTLLMSVLAGFMLETLQEGVGRVIENDYEVKAHEKLGIKTIKGVSPAITDIKHWYQKKEECRNIETSKVNHPEHGEESEFHLPKFLWAVSRSIILFLLWCGFYYAFSIAEKSRVQQIQGLKWEALKNEIELKNLRAQLNPHFLFNSLNSIRALIGINPEQAKISVTQLSILLRKSINLGKMKVIPLKEELDLVRTYLNLEQVRFEERLKTEFNIEKEAWSCEIPPLMVQTIVENGIKHGISKSIDGGIIRIEATFKENELKIMVTNSGDINSNEEGIGIGIENSKKRLAILFGEKADFSIRQNKEVVEVKINIVY